MTVKVRPALRDADDESPLWYCNVCKGEMYTPGPYVVEDGKRMCVDCFKNRVERLLKDSPELVADCLGMQYMERAEDEYL